MAISPATDTDVLVIGAGPAGSSTAAWAARAGLDVTLVDAEGERALPRADKLTLARALVADIARRLAA